MLGPAWATRLARNRPTGAHGSGRPCGKYPGNRESTGLSGNGLCFACFCVHEPHNGAHGDLSLLYRYGARVIGARYVGTRLAAKPFLISLLVITVLAVVGFLSFHAVGNLVAVNREIATHTIPAVRLAASTREAITSLIRLEMRALVLADPGYATAWNERAARVAEDLGQLAGYVQSKRESEKLEAARAAFEHYRRLVATEQELLQRGARAQALALPYSEARTRAEEVQENLDALMAAIHDRVVAAQAEARRLEARTWTGVLIALGAAVGLALLVALENARLHAQAQRNIQQLQSQARVPRLDESRAAHAPQRGDRILPGAREPDVRRGERAPARVPDLDPCGRPPPQKAGRRPARPGQGRCRAPDARSHEGLGGRRHPGGGRRRPGARAAEEHHADGGSEGAAAVDHRGPHAGPADDLQLAEQRDQVHGRGRTRHRDGRHHLVGGPNRLVPAANPRRRHRHRHQGRGSGANLRQVRARRLLVSPRAGRHRAWPR